jgi:methionine-rich copper-binding protein CopC
MNKQPISAAEILQYAIGGAQLKKNRAHLNFLASQLDADKNTAQAASNTLSDLKRKVLCFSRKKPAKLEITFKEILELAFNGAKSYALAMHRMEQARLFRYDEEANPWAVAYETAEQDAKEIERMIATGKTL